MANEITLTNQYPLPKDSYAAFDAISLRNLIIARLNEQGVYTDQNYLGYNIASIIDIVSYSFNTLMFYLNKTSTESMFTEAQLYENINRIVKLLDYKPIGYQTSTLSFSCSAQGILPGLYTIPRYSYLTLGGIAFSFNEDVSFNVLQQTPSELIELTNKKLLYQGIFREAPVYNATGDVNELYIVENPATQVDHFNLDVYVYELEQNKWIKYTNVPSLYSAPSYARAFEKRLNSDFNYEITFGDNINGRKLDEGDLVIVYYLQSTGEQGVIGPSELQGSVLTLFASSNFLSILFDTSDGAEYMDSTEASGLIFNNITGSTLPKQLESPEDIKRNAPANFKSQYRLVTKEDYETFVRINHSNFITDVKAFDNWEYTGSYLKYFKDAQVSPTSYKQILLNQVLYSDSCNFNNVYICAIPKIGLESSYKYLLPSQKELIVSDMNALKTLTAEITFVDPIVKIFSLGVNSSTSSLFDVSDGELTRLQIYKQKYSNRSSKSIINEVISIFQQHFNLKNAKLGGSFRYSSLVNEILTIEGVQSIKTISEATQESFDGLSFYFWNPSFPDLDKQVVTSNINLLDFQYYYFFNLSSLSEKIDIIEPLLS